MELKEAIMKRCSVRGYLDKPVSQETIREVLKLAVRAVSGENCQPWEFFVAAGDKLEELKEYNMTALRERFPVDRVDAGVPEGIFKTRSRTVGKALLGAMEIARENREGRNWWGERGYRFFDAPAVIFLLMDESLEETAYRLDMGCVAQNITLAAMEKGLGTCVEDQAVTYQKGARKILGIPENKRFVVGISIGYPDEEFPANHVISEREPVDNITTWCGFES
ncbi:MAG: nitroreductase [Lachnospiraceae bacterium]|nr:nitroreductase [Lachnospiraceae bacterium]